MVKKGSKMRPCNSCGIPGPLSQTSMSSISPAVRTRSLIFALVVNRIQGILDQCRPDLVELPPIRTHAGKVGFVVADHFHLAQAGGDHGQRVFQTLRDVDLLNGHLVHVGVVLDGT